MSMPEHFTQALIAVDVPLVRKMWQHIAPNMPQPRNDKEVLATIHMSRTQMWNISDKLRFYSHRWCLDNGFPSQLPDKLKSKAERMYPKLTDAVGLAVRSRGPHEAGPLILSAMENAVNDCYAEGDTEPSFVKKQLMEARAKEKKKLFG